MLELFLNTVTREWYDKDGNPFRDGMPRGAYQSREDVKITLCKETPNAGAAGVDVSTWTRDASLASVSGVGAMLTIDSDRIHKLKGELSGEVSAGAVSTITATIENASNATVPASGTLRLFDETGDYEAIAYTDRSIVDGEATFTVSGSVSGSYAVGSVIDCDQSPYAQAYLDTSASNLEQGELVFYLVIDSQRLRAEMDYSDVETLSIAGLELLIYRTADGASEPVTAYLCETYSVTGTLGSVGNEAQPPDATEDKLAGLVDQLLAAGLDVEQQYDSEGNTQFRVRSVSAGGTWSSWITVQKGEPGTDGKSFSVDATGLMSERSQYDSEAAGFSFLATDEGNLYIKNSASPGDWSDAIPFQGPAGEDGAPGPANTLTIGTVTTGEPGTQAAATITGKSPNQVLNLTIPRGDKGEAGEGGGTADSVAWDNVTGKPSTFPPSSHNHKISDINGLQSALDAKGTVKSVNGVEPDSSGNVTIETGGGESSSFGEWIPIEPAGEVVIAHNFNDAFAPGVLQLETGGKLYNIDSRVKFNVNDIVIDFTGLELEGEHNARFFGSLASMANLEMPVGAVARYEDYTGSMWSDTSGNSKNLNPSGTVNQDGGAAVFPDSSGKLTCSSGFGLTSTATICMVLSVPDGNSCWLTCELGTIGLYNNALNFGNTSSDFAASSDVGTAVQAGKMVNVIVTVNGSSINYYINNVKLGLGSNDRWETPVEATLGNVYDRYPFSGGKIFQCVIYDSVLAESDIARCYRYAKHKYAIG